MADDGLIKHASEGFFGTTDVISTQASDLFFLEDSSSSSSSSSSNSSSFTPAPLLILRNWKPRGRY